MDLNDFIFAELSTARKNFHDYDITFIGRRGSGKSTLAVEFFKDECCIIDVEKGNKQVSGVYKVEPNTWKEIKDLAKNWGKAIKKGAKPPFSVLLFDTQTKLQLMCQEYVLDTNGWDDMTQGDDGINRWNVLKTEYASLMDSFRELGFNVVRICHGKDKKFKPRGQEEYNQYTADVGATFDYDVLGAADFVFFLEKVRVKDESGVEKEVRRLILQNDMDYDVKCRFPELPDEIIYEEAKNGVKAFYEAWENAINLKDGKTTDKPKKVKKQEEVFPTKEVLKEDDFEDEEDDFDNEVSTSTDVEYTLEELIVMAENKRDKMLEDGIERDVVKKLLKDTLGTMVVKKCQDESKLLDFINK